MCESSPAAPPDDWFRLWGATKSAQIRNCSTVIRVLLCVFVCVARRIINQICFFFLCEALHRKIMRRTFVCTSLSCCFAPPTWSSPPSVPAEHHRGTRDPKHLVCGSGSWGPVDVCLHHQRSQVQSPLLPRLHRFRRGECSETGLAALAISHIFHRMNPS